jgi:enoyl-CoA hydratase/carnithine racemase
MSPLKHLQVFSLQLRRAMQVFLLAEMVTAEEALRIRLVDKIAEVKVQRALRRVASSRLRC